MRIFSKIVRAVLYLFTVTLTLNVSAQYAIEKELGSKALGLLQFNAPQGVVSESNGNFYVADQRTVYRMSPSGDVIHQWTHPSESIVSLDLDEDNNVIVASYTRIFRLTADLQLLNEFGTYGQEDGQLAGTIDLATDSDNKIYILDRVFGIAPSQGTFRVQVFSPDGTFLNKPISSSAGYYNSNTDYFQNLIVKLAVHSNHMALAGYSYDYQTLTQSRVRLYTLAGEFLNTIGSWNFDEGRINYPRALTFDSAGNVLVADESKVFRFALDGAYLSSFMIPAITTGGYRYTVDIAEEPDHNILICDYGTERTIERVSATGVSLTIFGRGDGEGQFKQPSDVAKDSQGNIYVVDLQNFRIQKFDGSGNFLLQFGSRGSGPGQFNTPRRIEIDQHDNVFILDTNFILKFDSNGNFIQRLANNRGENVQFDYAVDFELDVANNVYVLNSNFVDVANVQKFTNDGQFISMFGTVGNETGNLNNVVALAVDSDGDIYINDLSNSLGGFRIQHFTSEGTYLGTTPPGIYCQDMEVDKYNNLYGRGYNSVFGFTSEGIITFILAPSGDNEFINGGFYIDPATQKIIVTGEVGNNVLLFNCPLPKPKFTINPALGGSPTLFIDESTEVAPSATYKWEFGDGATSDLRGNTEHIYTETKEYTATLTINQTCISGFSKTFNLTTSLESDSLTLVDFYNKANGANWINESNWLTGDIGTWYGVSLKNGRVAGLEFRSNNNIQGSLPSSLTLLEKLERLVISNNSIENGIPTWFEKLKELNTLILSNSQLTGKLPESVGSLVKLDTLDLSSNHLTDTIPGSLGQLSLLRYLDLANNSFEKNVPSSFSNLTNAVTIKLANNDLIGLPDLSSISSLETLSVEGNQLSFGDIEPNLAILNFTYAPQENIQPAQNSLTFYETGVLSLTVPVSGRANQYQWFKDGAVIEGANASTYNLQNITQSDAGKYQLQITSTVVTDLTLLTSEISVSVVVPPDNDQDGYSAVTDCNDADPTIYPGAQELCDGKDNDCDGNIDAGCSSPMLWGLASGGGPGGSGTIFSLYADGSNGVHLKYSYEQDVQYPSLGGLLELADSSKVGLANAGGVNGLGGIFRIYPDGTERVIFSFSGANGSMPYGSLLQGTDGALYGMTSQGGSSNVGTVFKINTNGSGHVVLHNFSGANGGIPNGSLLQGTDGALYGMTLQGGLAGVGTIFKINTDGSGHTVLHNFSGNGSNPHGSLLQGTDGALFGMTSQGGTSGLGTVFKINIDGSGHSVLHNFSGSNGSNPFGSLLQGTDGALYGMTLQGGLAGVGTIFKINADGSEHVVLHNFSGSNGSNPLGSLLQGTDGALYGMTFQGGSSNVGTVFKINADGSEHVVLHNFSGSNGSNPSGSLLQEKNGDLYGMTNGGGSGAGTIFKIIADGSAHVVLHNFKSNKNGSYPLGSLLQGKDGALFGMTLGGGSSGLGTVFKINIDGSGHSVLHSFSGSNGSNPYGSLLQSTDGALYGMTNGGGFSGVGTIFKINADGSGYVVLHNFIGSNGSSPLGSLLQATDGALYGMTSQGGSSGNGTIFKINADGSGHTVLHNFNYTNGSNPYGSLYQGTDGSLYGMTVDGGSSGFGTIFKINADGSEYVVLHNFNDTNGRYPFGCLLQGTDGALFGMTSQGGSSGFGTVFKINTDGSGHTLLYNFNGSNGSYPFGSLTLYSNKLFGYTATGGNYDGGVLFNYDLAAGSFSKLSDLSPSTGQYPQYGSLLLVNPANIQPPSIPASNLLFTNVTNKSMTISFTSGNGEKRVVLMKDNGMVPLPGAAAPAARAAPTGAGPVDIMDGTELSGNPDFSQANEYQTGWRVVYAGSDSSVTVTGLQGNHIYQVTVIEYNGSNTETRYLNSFPPVRGQVTLLDVLAPTEATSNITFSNVLSTSMKVNFAPGNGGQRLAILTQGSAPAFVPANDAFYSGNLGNGEQVVYNGNGNSFTLSQLLPDTEYFVTLYEFNTDSTLTKYLTAGPPVASQRTLTIPVVFVTTPANGAVNQNAALNVTARAVTGATSYTIELSTDPEFISPKVRTGGRTLNFDSLQYNTLYYTRVKTNLRNDYGQVTTFTTRTAESLAFVTSPANNAVNTNTALSFTSNAVLYAATYTIQLSESANFSTVAFEVTGNSRTLSFTGLKFNTLYYNRVKTNLSPEFGEVRNFTTRTAESLAFVTSPANNAVSVNTVLNITSNAVTGVSQYTIQLSETSDFATIDFEVSGSTRTLAFSGLKYNTTYYNRVKTDLSSEFGQVRSFTTRTAESISYVTSPGNNAMGTNTTLNISSNIVPGATQYTIQLSETPDFATVAFEVSGGTRTLAFSGLKYNTTYYNRVLTNLTTNFGLVRSFSTRTAESISYVTSPANNAVNVNNTSLSITANSVPGASTYTIQLSESPDFTSVDFEVTGPTRTLAFANLKYNTMYYNRVITDLTLVYGQVRSFKTRTAESLAYVTNPANGATNRATALNITSNTVPGATSYTIQLSEARDFSTIAFEVTGPARTLAFTGLTTGTTYFNRVLTNLTGNYGAVRSFTTQGVRPSGARMTADSKPVIAEAEKELKEFEVSVYPIPFREKLVFYIESVDQQAEVTLTDLNGRNIHQSTEKTNQTIQIIKEFSPGAYLLRIKTEHYYENIRVVRIE